MAAQAPKPINFNAVKALLFDIDGTLTNSDDLHLLAFQKLLSEAGFADGKPISEAFFKENISGRHNPEIAANLFPTWSAEQGAVLLDNKEQYFRDIADGNLKPIAGLLEFLDWAEARGIRKVAVTNAPRANAELMLKALGIRQRFEAVVLAEECTNAKPHPEPYLTGLRLLGARAEEALVFEDSLAGVTAGVAAGVHVVGILSTQSKAALAGVGAATLVHTYDELLALARSQESKL